MKKTSLNDIAQQLGVSKTLVSLVLNGKGNEYRISEDIQKKVKELARKLNYKPNQIAKGLRTGKTNTIGLIIADIANPFFGKLGREIEREAASHGYRVMFCSSDEKAENAKLQIEMLQQGQVDGFIISPPNGSEEQIKQLKNSKTPFVLIDRYFPEIESNCVVVDNLKASCEGTEHLIKNGRKRIACITTNPGMLNMDNRLDGYKKALTDAALEVDENLIKILPFSHEIKDVMEAIKELTSLDENKIDAILFTTSKVGVMGIQCLHLLDLKIPEDVAVVSFDDLDAYKISRPSITAIAQPLEEIGKHSVKILLEAMTDKSKKKELHKIVLETKFVIRNSSIK
ncbi:LacI family DNA-binding transcriptional regulator [Prolixibacteraceae bacterium Z1-6]|uniref:LacI family DNA-binding transcriptional regulator n=1 Tax=Draconibacterium aestuarii TaxID=2998507 RepID=A0A9X3J6A1_9BACT|nr:LacI family DNA-binding transcriptional regulator [Prolixibacteraceae bacterium Z1-6]